VIDYLLAVMCNKTKQNKKFKTIWENLQSKQTNAWLENKESSSQKSKRAFLTTTVIRQLWVPYWGPQPTFVSIICMYVCMYVSRYVCMYIYVCMCVFFTNLFRGTYLIE
jgi:hypothetical protein